MNCDNDVDLEKLLDRYSTRLILNFHRDVRVKLGGYFNIFMWRNLTTVKNTIKGQITDES